MEQPFTRTEWLLGPEKMERFLHTRIAVFGVGGVGGYVVEALARCGIGILDLIDHDTVAPSNLNRQILALHSTIGRLKVEVMAERIRDINPDAVINTYPLFYLPDQDNPFDFSQYDYVVDAIDTVSGKLGIIAACKAAKTPVISSMGTGNKQDPSQFRIGDLYDTSVDPLARVMRRECKKRGISQLTVLYSTEQPIKPLYQTNDEASARRPACGTLAFVPSSAGLLIASHIIRELAARR